MRRDYQHEADSIERARARCPKACALWDRLFDELSAKGSDHRLEVALVCLGHQIELGREIPEYAVEYYESLLPKAVA